MTRVWIIAVAIVFGALGSPELAAGLLVGFEVGAAKSSSREHPHE